MDIRFCVYVSSSYVSARLWKRSWGTYLVFVHVFPCWLFLIFLDHWFTKWHGIFDCAHCKSWWLPCRLPNFLCHFTFVIMILTTVHLVCQSSMEEESSCEFRFTMQGSRFESELWFRMGKSMSFIHNQNFIFKFREEEHLWKSVMKHITEQNQHLN